MFEEAPGSYDTCKICFWEDDAVQLRYPNFAGGANGVSLIEAQKNFQKFGAVDQKSVKHIRKPTPEEKKDDSWRVIDLSHDIFQIPNIKDGRSYFDAAVEVEREEKLYYWRK